MRILLILSALLLALPASSLETVWGQSSGSAQGPIGDEDTLEQIFNMREFSPGTLAYDGGATDFYFSQGTGGLLSTTGNDSNAGTRAAPMLTCGKMEEIINSVEGARIWVDGADGAWQDGGANNCDTLLSAIDLPCDGTRGACAAISAMDPDFPFIIDGASTSIEDAIQCTADSENATLLVQNVNVIGITNADALDTDSYCRVIALNFNGTVTGNGSDNIFTPHDDVGGGIWVLGDRSGGEVLAAGSGTNFVFAAGAGTSYMGVISRGLFVNSDDVASQAVVSQSGGADGAFYAIGPSLVSGASTAAGFVLLDSLSGSGNTHYWKLARTTLQGAGATNQLFRTVANAADEHVFVEGYQNSFVGNGIGLWLFTQGLEADSTLSINLQDTLIDGMGGSIVEHDGPSDSAGFSFNLQGVFDEDDDAASWDIDSTTYATLVLAQAGYPSGWTIGTDSTYADLGTAGTECGHNEDDCASPTVTLPVGVCHSARECETQAVTGTYTLMIDDPLGLPYVFPGTIIRGFRLNRGQMGAR